MKLENMSALVTGGASGLGLACARRLVARGVKVVIVDLNRDAGAAVEKELGSSNVVYAHGDVTNTEQINAALDAAERLGTLRALVHCAGIGGAVRLVEKDGQPGSLEKYEQVVRVNLVGSFNMLRLSAARMAKNEVIDGERGAMVMTASVAAFEGQIGQIPYSASKAGVVGMTIVAARDLATKFIRVCTIAPGLFNTPLLARLPDNIKQSLGASVPHPARLGEPDEFAMMAMQILENPMLNGETIRLDGAIRMAPR
jgi:NAD(P)-dependent dehydrogenase (short-subunit alcohol dehydrogenase family)